MATTSVGVYELHLEQTYGAESVLNVFHYLSNTSEDDKQDLIAQAFDEDVMAGLALVSNTTLKYNLIRVKNLTGTLADAVLVPSQADGDIVGTPVSSFIAASIRYDRTDKSTRNGAKRFCGLVEEDIEASTFTAAYLTKLQTLATLLAVDISTVGQVGEPIILRKPVGPGGVWTYNPVASCTALDRLTSQNSRKIF